MARNTALTLAATVLAVLSAAPALAAEVHIGAAVGRADYRIDTTGATSADTRGTAGKVFFGATFTPHLGVEFSGFHLGRARGAVAVPGVGQVEVAARVRGLGLSGVVSAPLGPVSVFAKAGIAKLRARVDTSVSTGLPGSERAWRPVLGLGLAWPLGGAVVARGEWERVRVRFPGGGQDAVDLLSLGLVYRF